MTATRQVSYSNGTPIGNNVDGGFVFVGVEGYAETDCDIGQVNYSLNDLVIACSNIGIELAFPQPRAYNSFIRSHTGSLRSVLRSWCAEVNYTFGWNWSEQVGKVDFINLQGATSVLPSKITEIKNIVDNMNTSDQPIVLDVQESTSIKETSKNYNVTFYQASKLQANQDRSINYLQHFAALYLDDVVHAQELQKSYTKKDDGGFIHNRYDYAEFFTSMALASVSQSAADIYNATQGYLGYFGYSMWAQVDNKPFEYIEPGGKTHIVRDMKRTLISAASAGTNGIRDQTERYYRALFRVEATTAVSWSGGAIEPWMFDIYLGVKPNDNANSPASKGYERDIASSFAGKYFWSQARPKKYRTCTKSITYDVGFEYSPSVTDVFSPVVRADAENTTSVNKNAPWFRHIGPRYGMQSFLWPQQSIVDYFGNPTRSVWTNTPIKVIEREAKFGNVVQYDVYNTLDSTVVRKGSPMSELCIDTCGIDIFNQFKPMVSKWKHGQPGISARGGLSSTTSLNALESYLDKKTRSLNTACNPDGEAFKGQDVELFVVPHPHLVKKFMHVVPVEDVYGNLNVMTNPEEETYVQNIKQDQEGCTKICDDQKNYIKDEICDCDQEIFSGPGDLSAQTIDFQNQLLSPQPNDEPHAHGLYNNTTFGATLSFLRNNPWRKDVAHGTQPFDTHLNIALPTASFRVDVGKYLPEAVNSRQVPTDGSFNASQWIRSNFKEKIAISYTLPKDTSVKNTFNSSLPGNVAKIRVNEKNVTSDLRRIDGNCADAASVINMYVPSVGFVDLDTYHNLYSALANTGSEYPRKTLSVTLDGMKLGPLADYAQNVNGLNSWQISMDTQGYKTSIAWQNKPATYPSEELSMISLKPEMVFSNNF